MGCVTTMDGELGKEGRINIAKRKEVGLSIVGLVKHRKGKAKRAQTFIVTRFLSINLDRTSEELA